MTVTARLRNRAAEWARGWARRRQGPDTSPLVLHRRRVYILPSGLGLVFAMLLLGMLLGAMNYNNNLGFAVTFLLAGVALVSMYHCHRNLTGLAIRKGRCDPVFVGEQALPGVILENATNQPRLGLTLALDDLPQAQLDLLPGDNQQAFFRIPAQRRGRIGIRRFSVASTFPFGLFRVWTWVHMRLDCLVFPRPAERAPPPPTALTDIGGAQLDRHGGDDFAGLRDYRAGDPPRHIAWKAFARGQELLVRQYAGTSVANHVFDLDQVPAAHLEERLSILCRWILDAHRAGEAYGLCMPGVQVLPAVGIAHLEHCLGQLALFGIEDPGQ